MSDTMSKAGRYRLACEAAHTAYPTGCEIIDYGQVVLTATVTEAGKVKIVTAPAMSISPDKIMHVFLPWFRDTFEPPKDEAAEIIKGLRVEEMPEVGLTDAGVMVLLGRVDKFIALGEMEIAKVAYRAGAVAMWEKVRRG